MADYPPLNRFYVASYAANDRDYPVVAIRLDPRVAGYKVPEDLSPHPDSKRYPNHVFTGAQPSSGDQIVTHIYEILPAPWVPFTRYDDDLGPIQGRRRAVKNEGQQADLASDRKISYEGREGSAIVSLEIEETWSIKVDEDGNSLFPIKDRDFYDASRGAVQERRQLFVPTGEEVGSLENVNGVITQTSYEPYNEFLSVKIVQTYKVDGPQLIGRATDNDGQLITVTTQRRGALNYIPPNPTATRTVEVSREDAESLVERIVDTPEIFKANTFSVERPDPIPQKFRVAVPIQSSQEIVEGDADPNVSLDEGELSKSEEQRNKFIKRVSSTSRDQAVLPQTLTGKSTNNERQEVTVTETLQLGNTDETPTATKTVESEALGDGNYVITKTQVDEVFSAITFSKERPDLVPPKFRTAIPSLTRQENLEGEAEEPTLVAGEIVKSEQQVNQFVKRISTTARDAAQLPKSLTQKLTTNEGLLATVTETLQNGDTTAVPTSKKTVESEALGDGTYVVRVTESPKVFSAKTFRAEKADLTPQKFRAKQSDLTTEENIEGTAAQPTLGENQFLKSEQQINEFVKRVTTNSRTTELNENLSESVITPEGQLATRTITLSKSAQTLVPSATVIDGNVEELGDGRTVKTEVRVDEVFDGKQESLEKPEVIPPEFRASLQNRTISEIKTGQAISLPSLSQEELSKTIQRLTEHKIRETKVTRPSSSYPSLTGELVDNDQIKVTRTRTVAKGDQTIAPSATVSGTVEALGDGFTLKTQDTKANIFNSKQRTFTQAAQIPAKFLDRKITETNFIEEGTTEEPEEVGSDGFGVVQSSSQRVNAFLRRQTQREQEGTTSLTEEQTNNFKQKVTVTSSIVDDPEVEPSAKTEFARTQAIGGGKYVKEIGTVEEVFAQQSFTKEKPDPAPQKFRIELPALTDEVTAEATSVSEGDVNLGPDDLAKSVQQVDAFTKRTRTTSRSGNADGSLSGEVFTTELGGGKATVVENYGSNPTIDPAFGTISSEKEALGGGKFLTREVTLTNPPPLAGQEYDETYDVLIPYTEQFVEGGTTDIPNASIVPRDVFHSRQRIIDVEAARQAYLDSFIVLDDVVNISLPDKLIDVIVNIEKIEGGENQTSEGNSCSASATAFASYDLDVGFEVRNGFSGPAFAKKYIFFVDASSPFGSPQSETGIMAKLNGVAGEGSSGVKAFPVFRTKSETIITKVISERITATASVSLPKNKNKSLSVDKQVNANIINIPPTLHGSFSIKQRQEHIVERKAEAVGEDTGTSEVIAKAKAQAIISQDIIQSFPEEFPTGRYLVSVNSQPYRFNLTRVEAVVVEVTEDMV